MTGLTDFQVEVAQQFFALPASDGFVLAGGAALLVSGLTTRPTEDLDLFGERGRSKVVEAGEQFTAAATQRGWIVSPVHISASFVRLHVSGEEELRLDIAIDVAANHPVVVSIVGPTFDPEEQVGRKLVALFDRAEARDFADVYGAGPTIRSRVDAGSSGGDRSRPRSFGACCDDPHGQQVLRRRDPHRAS